MSKIAMLAKLTAQAGKRDELVKVLEQLVEGTRTEPGTLAYTLHAQADDENAVWFYELYENADALQAHSTSETMRAAGPQLAGLLAGRPELIRLEPKAGKSL